MPSRPSPTLLATRTRRDRRRPLAVAVAAPALFAILTAAGGGWGPTPPVGWIALVGLTAVAGAVILAGYVPLAGQRATSVLGCTPCAAMGALTIVGAAFLLGFEPHDVPMALAALSLVVLGLVQRRAGAAATCPTGAGRS